MEPVMRFAILRLWNSRQHLARVAFAATLMSFLVACGRTELEVPEDIPSGDASDVVIDRPEGGRCVRNADCDDGVFCNGTELCTAGACTRGLPVQCDDRVACTRDSCNEVTRACDAIPDNTRCMAPATCDRFRDCVNTRCQNDGECDNGDVCDGLETCVAGTCQAGLALRCDDGIDCTIDECNPMIGCGVTPDDGNCDDGIFCNGAEGCTPMGCQPRPPVLCADPLGCTAQVCDEATQMCRAVGAVDNDRDGFPPVRCPGGGDCDDNNNSVNPRAREICRDGIDNNCNGRLDCADPACAGTIECGPCVPSGPERDARTCQDGLDNDCSGLIDCADPGCLGSPVCGCMPRGPENNPFACGDGIDNDCDGLLDCADRECAMQPGCVICVPTGPEGAAGTCRDGRDNNCNGALDCADPACSAGPECVPVNDTCATARPISLPGMDSGTTIGARNDFDPSCSPGGTAPDVVYVFRNPVQQTITIDTIGSNYDTMLMVYRDQCGMGAQLACDDDMGGGVSSRIVLNNAAPGTYFVIVDGFGAGSGSYQLHLTLGVREQCQNGVDDDGDGLIDCADGMDCGADPFCVMCVPRAPVENAGVGTCTNGVDEDCDGDFDCMDPDCAGSLECGVCMPTGRESGAIACRDGIDNDCDMRTDCADLDCSGMAGCACIPTSPENNPFFCRDGVDNDCDGQTDCLDAQCAALPFCVMCMPTPENTALACADGRDNDCDMRADCADPDCASLLVCCRPTGPENTAAACRDGVDNDCDGRADCMDPDCAAQANCCVASPEVCNDGRDNDCDSLVDCMDNNCAADPACVVCVPTGPEANDVACSDMRDNDCDRQLDCADPDCASAFVCCVPSGAENTDATCSDMRDNDCDRAVDCMDPGCAMTRPCRNGPPNDLCAGAISVGVPSVTMGTSVNAGNDFVPVIAGFPGCAGGAGPDVVYTFNVAARTPLTVDLTGNGFDPVVFVRRAPCEMGSQVACNDDTFGTNSRVAFTADPGTYFVFVDGFNANSQGAFTLTISVGLPAEVCNNGRDDDADMLTDCADPDCVGAANCMMCVPAPENTVAACQDGRDNDCDMQIDCADANCAAIPACCRPTGAENSAAACMDGRDNDCDQQLDCADPDCAAVPMCCRPTGPENTAAACQDGRDNDCNLLRDCADPACAAVPACCRPTGTEGSRTSCTDGIDNDCDGQTDCVDTGCSPLQAVGSNECCNGRDDDGNGAIDEFACQCATNVPDCVGVGAGGNITSPSCYPTLPFAAPAVCGPDCRSPILGGNRFCTMFNPGTTCNMMTGACTR